MGYTTDIVFITHDASASMRFAAIVREHHTRYGPDYNVVPVEDNAEKTSSTTVYHLGLNYAPVDLTEALRNEPWPPDTVLWISREDDAGPEVRVGGAVVLAPPPTGWWA